MSQISSIERDQDKLYHTIVIDGRKEDKILIGFLEIYGALKTFMIIDDQYEGEDFIEGYCHDLMDSCYGFIDPDVKIPISSHNLRDLITKCSDGNILYQLQLGLYRNGVVLATYKSRYYHLKKFLLKLKEDYNIPDINLTEKNTTDILNTIVNEFIKRGIEIKYIEDVKDKEKGAENVQKIVLLLDYLRILFKDFGLNQTIIISMIVFFRKKEPSLEKEMINHLLETIKDMKLISYLSYQFCLLGRKYV